LTENCEFFYSRVFNALADGFPSNFVTLRRMGLKTRTVGYHEGKKFDNIFSRFRTIHECDGETDRQTDRQTDGHRSTDSTTPCIASRGKNATHTARFQYNVDQSGQHKRTRN